MHSQGKGISRSTLPYKKAPPSWCMAGAKNISEEIIKLAKKGLFPSQIGVFLRDTVGIPQVCSITGAKILRILRKEGIAPKIPEDLFYLIKNALSVRKHLEKFRKDKDGKFRLILIESRIHRLTRYYKLTEKLPSNWKYNAATAAALVS